MAAMKALAGPVPHPGIIFYNVHWCIVNGIRDFHKSARSTSSRAYRHSSLMDRLADSIFRFCGLTNGVEHTSACYRRPGCVLLCHFPTLLSPNPYLFLSTALFIHSPCRAKLGAAKCACDVLKSTAAAGLYLGYTVRR
ncbi:hypothetical protein C8J57DRAFT_1528892 [Mycena rebaudengoi]|nr:hypothetical protein C8J57DRAFT_1528892 [Mycena rebaudengoi]